MHWFMLALSRYAVFSGRSQRAEFWFYMLISVLIQGGLLLVDHAAGLIFWVAGVDNGILSTLAVFALLLPSLSVGARRLHDTGLSGWWQLLILVPILGLIVLLVLWARQGQAGLNAHGNNPKLASTH